MKRTPIVFAQQQQQQHHHHERDERNTTNHTYVWAAYAWCYVRIDRKIKTTVCVCLYTCMAYVLVRVYGTNTSGTRVL